MDALSFIVPNKLDDDDGIDDDDNDDGVAIAIGLVSPILDELDMLLTLGDVGA